MDRIEAIKQAACSTPGKKIRSKGKGRGLARGKGKGPLGIPIKEKEKRMKKSAFDQAYINGVIYAVKEAMASLPKPKGMQVFRKPIGSPVILGKLPKQKTTGIKLGSAKIAEFLAKHGASPFTTHGRPQTSLPALKSQVQGAQPGMLNKTLTAGSGSSMPSLSGASLKPPAMKATPRPATT